MSLKTEDLAALVARGKPVRVKAQAIQGEENYYPQRDERQRVVFSALLAMLPEPIQIVAEAIEHRMIRDEETDWHQEWHTLTDAVLTHAGTLTFIDPFERNERAPCPLCRATPRDAFPTAPKGFAVPDGLERHFTGSGNARWCPVGQALFYWLRDEHRNWRQYHLQKQQRELRKTD